ncbi:FecCD family ABC transporter permease [Parafrankia discariae]|uniref:FecCD family ABC transporter permease n=1 Tax=Parafrankia discariae TaxID=365528 RepID=UPI000362E540|nr:iron chelate uptake ABC transporter family permease subunit [Parafrankia discariae]
MTTTTDSAGSTGNTDVAGGGAARGAAGVLPAGAGRVVVRLERPPVSGVLRPRVLVVGLLLALATFAAFCFGMTLGDYPVSLTHVVPAMFGSGDAGSVFIVQELRLPRALVALLAGLALGMSGAVFQTMTRNPLASPDMIGINSGASTAVVAGLALGFGSGLGTDLLGLLGALATAVLVYLLAWRRGATGYRIILVGIGVSWMCMSLTDYLMTRAEIVEAHRALGWMVGNLNAKSWSDVGPLAVAVLVLAPTALMLGRWMNALALGDDVASGLGIPIQRARLTMLLAGVGLVAFATAAAGPVAFVSLAAPQIAQRLAGLAWPPLVGSALTGSLIILVSDIIARQLLTDTQLPVGIVTGVLGAPFLLWLLARANSTGSGG